MLLIEIPEIEHERDYEHEQESIKRDRRDAVIDL